MHARRSVPSLRAAHLTLETKGKGWTPDPVAVLVPVPVAVAVPVPFLFLLLFLFLFLLLFLFLFLFLSMFLFLLLFLFFGDSFYALRPTAIGVRGALLAMPPWRRAVEHGCPLVPAQATELLQRVSELP